jgi:Fur family transcriptional regulator, ferric uptake regulator
VSARRAPTIGGIDKREREDWVEHALSALRDAGFRRGGARRAVVELLGEEDCALTALEIETKLQRRNNAIGRASVYRALEQLESLRLVQRLEMGTGTASYERVRAGGEHHHHLVCERCGAVIPFEDSRLERAIDDVSRSASFEVSDHDITLRGLCRGCAG